MGASDGEILRLKQLNASLNHALEETMAIREDARTLLVAADEEAILEVYFDILRRVLAQESTSLDYFRSLGPDGPYRLSFNDHGPVEAPDSPDLPVDFEMQDFLQQERKPVSFSRDSGLEIWIPMVRTFRIQGITRAVVPDSDRVTMSVLERLHFVTIIAASSLQARNQSRDIRRQNDDLATERRRMASLVEAINVGLFSFDTSLKLLHANRNGAMMLRLGDATPGRPIRDLLDERTMDFVESMLKEYSEQGFVMDQQFSVEMEGAGELSIGVNLAPLMGPEAELDGYVLTLRDMTASQELDRLRRLDQMKSDFVNNVSHELRTPLTSIKAYTEALEGMLEEEMHLKFLKVVSEESDRLLGMIENLLNVSRIESGKMVLHREPLQLMTLLSRVVEITAVQSDAHQVILDEADLPEFECDADKMTEVFINIVGNAIKYSPEGGEVRILPSVKDGNIEVAISDQGIGLSVEDCKKVFDQFYRVDSSATATIGGTGLGLAITKSIINAHGGVIRVTSELGTGSTFTVVLPCDAAGAVDEIELMPGSSPFG